jgi:hypothetical protein
MKKGPVLENKDTGSTALDPCLTYLSIVEPYPMEPPSYASTLPYLINKPIYDDMKSLNEKLPSYSPTVYKLGILFRKIEWISPLEMASQRHWKPYIFELNSTQLNLYECPFKTDDPIIKKFDVSSSFSNSNSHSLLHPYHHHHLYLKKLQGFKSPSAIEPNIEYSYNEDNFRSIMTTKTDLKALKYFKSIHALDSTKIIRSYSLQYGKIGLAIDYKKKSHVFRCRFETEQFLLNFSNVEGMIEWYNAINLGIDNSLDLSRREMPTYRIIPRRRRRKYIKHHNLSTKSIAFNLGIHSNNDSNNTTNHLNQSRRGSTSNNSLKLKDENKKSLSLFKLGNNRRSSITSSNLNSNSNSNSISSNGLGSTDIFGLFKKNRSKSTNSKGEILENKPDCKSTFLSSSPASTIPTSTINTTRSKTTTATTLSLPSSSSSSLSPTQNNTTENFSKLTISQIQEHDSLNDYHDEGEENLPVDEDGFEIFVDDDEDEFEIDEATDPDQNNEFDSDSDNDLEMEIEQQQQQQQQQNGQNNVDPLSSQAGNNTPLNSINSTDLETSNNSSIIISSLSNLNNYKLRSYKEYIAKPSPHSINTHTYPAQRKILRDSLRCMVPLTENERWINKFVLLDYTKSYRPQSKADVNRHYQSFELLTHVSTVGHNYVHRFCRPLQEWIVTPSGLIPYINPTAVR